MDVDDLDAPAADGNFTACLGVSRAQRTTECRSTGRSSRNSLQEVSAIRHLILQGGRESFDVDTALSARRVCPDQMTPDPIAGNSAAA
jgi:hypothetical protein